MALTRGAVRYRNRNCTILTKYLSHGISTKPSAAANAGLCSVTCDSEYAHKLDFTDYRNAFKSKTTWELLRALTVLRVCSNQLFSRNSLKASKLGFYFRFL